MSVFKVGFVDDGKGIWEFMRMTAGVEGVERLFVQVGEVEVPLPAHVRKVGVEELKGCRAVVFRKVGDGGYGVLKGCVDMGVPVVVYKGEDRGLVRHELNGYLYLHENWGTHWLRVIRDKGVAPAAVSAVSGPVKVTVITPTWKRDPRVLMRCISCMKLQTFQGWEQVVCSDGESEEADARRVVETFRDSRVRYEVLGKPKREGDYGNSVRSEMLAKARGEYVLFFDDDNLILPSYLERMLGALEGTAFGFAVCRILHFGPLNTMETKLVPPVVLEGEPVKLFWVDPLQCLIRREAMAEVGWDCKVGYLSDGVSLERLGQRQKRVRVGEILGVHC